MPQSSDTFPFTQSHINKFKKELIKAGGFIPLMFEKQAIKRRDEINYIVTYRDIEEYKMKFLTGAYKSLRPLYDTELPYSFWELLFAYIYEKGLAT